MSLIRNPVQSFIRNTIRLVILVPLWLLIARPDFLRFLRGSAESMGWLVVKTVLIFWLANVVAKMFFILPQWERLVLLRLGKSVGERGPGMFIIPPFIYSVARILDVRITTYEVKATKTLTKDNIPIDVTAAVELEIENPEKAAIDVQDYWKTT
jgi:regulator of protease activity HflC (stomatin/prohibitin superfamily)